MEPLLRRDFFKSLGLGSLVLGCTQSPASAHDCLPAGITRDDLTGLIDGPWQRLRAVMEKKVIDFHTHNWQFEDTALTFTERATTLREAPAVDYSAQQVRDMQIHGIDKAVAIPPRLAKGVTHDMYVQSVAKYPGKLLEVADVDRAVQMDPKDKLERIRQRLKAGARIMSVPGVSEFMSGREPFDAAKLRPFCELAEEYDVPVEGDVPSIAGIWTYRDPEVLIPLFQTFPKVKFCPGDSGGAKGLGFMVPGGYKGLEMAAYFENLYWVLDAAPISFIEMAVKTIGAERILFATDIGYPGIRYYLPRGYRAASMRFRNLNAVALADITEDQRDMILYKNARRLLKLDA